MAKKNWYLCLHNETVGPLSETLLTKMVSEHRVSGSDYVCAEGQTSWVRVADCDAFSGLMPKAPSVPVPTATVGTEAKAAPAKAVEPAPAAAPAKAPTKPKLESVPAPAPMPPAAPAPAPTPVKIVLDATIKIGNGKACKVLELTETGVVFEKSEALELGSDVKVRLESPTLGKAIEVTAVVVKDETFEGKAALGVEFTRMNPAHRRAIGNYLSGKTEKAAA
jgi:hypothetical protein